MDPLQPLSRLAGRLVPSCRIPSDLTGLISVAEEEVPAQAAGVSPEAIERVWERVEALYRTGAYPALQICIRCDGRVLLERALGHASGNGPNDAPDAPKRPATVDTLFNLFSAAKAIPAMVIHKLDEKRALHLEDRVCDFIPEFGRYGKDRITIRHILLLGARPHPGSADPLRTRLHARQRGPEPLRLEQPAGLRSRRVHERPLTGPIPSAGSRWRFSPAASRSSVRTCFASCS
jgi:CubicO group peptidase (beta-lactamase class C family)